MEYPKYNVETLKVLIYNENDVSSREFLATVPPDAWAGLTVINWYSKSNYELQQWYLDCGFPGLSTFPSLLIGLPTSKSFGERDEVMLLSPKEGARPSYADMMNEADSELVLSIVRNVCMSESYKLAYIREQILQDLTIPLECFTIFACARTVREFEIMYARLVLEGKLVRNLESENKIKDKTEIDLGFTLKLPPEKDLVENILASNPNLKCLEL